ncbi:MAG: hypothetical protein IJ883_04250, partial [Eubacterium sp.]|nr:hypothetical protein [Eubacterium sp.]
MKKVLSTVLILCMVLSVSGCSFDEIDKTTEQTTVNNTVDISMSSETEMPSLETTMQETKTAQPTTVAPTKAKIVTNHKVKVKYKPKKLKLKDIPKYKVVKAPYVRVNGNKPTFTKKEIKRKSYQKFSKLDSLGRCGVAIASIGKDIMPKHKRTSISSVY